MASASPRPAVSPRPAASPRPASSDEAALPEAVVPDAASVRPSGLFEVRRVDADHATETQRVIFFWRRLAVPEHLRGAHFPLHLLGSPPEGPDDGRRWVAVAAAHVTPGDGSDEDEAVRFFQTTERTSRVCDALGLAYGDLLALSILGRIDDEVTVDAAAEGEPHELVWWARGVRGEIFPMDVSHWQVYPGVPMLALPWVHDHPRRARARDALASLCNALDEAAPRMPEGVYVDLCAHAKRVHEDVVGPPRLA